MEDMTLGWSKCQLFICLWFFFFFFFFKFFEPYRISMPGLLGVNYNTQKEAPDVVFVVIWGSASTYN